MLANLAAALDGEGARLTNYDKEVRQRKWYLQVMNQTEAEALSDGRRPAELRPYPYAYPYAYASPYPYLYP